MRAIILAGLAALLALPASAANFPKIAPLAGGDCTDPQDNLTMTMCATADAAAADKELNDVYTKVIASIRATDTDIMPADKVKDWERTMRDGERAWVAFRDADCDGAVGYEWYGGSGASLAVASCRRDLTRARIADLTTRYIDR
jgi:uncharacterized protein YecT (DUF1311 family)